MTEFDVASRMQRHDLHKFHGLGNDFLIWFRHEVPDDVAPTATAWCDRTTGFGADGLIIAIDRRRTTQFALINADGSRAEISGNGLRCFGHAICRSRGVDDAELVVETDAGERHVAVRNALSGIADVTVSMGTPIPGPELKPIDIAGFEYLAAQTIDIGNPHIVLEVADPMSHDMALIGPAIEAAYLPTGINVHVMRPVDGGAVMNIWERGAGVTEACGSGATAVAAVLSATEYESETTITMPGGAVTVAKRGEEMLLSGPSAYVGALVPWTG